MRLRGAKKSLAQFIPITPIAYYTLRYSVANG